jgi:molybdopterin molybdotransferase
MMGRDPNNIQTVEAILKNNIINADGREVYARVSLKKTKDKYYATTTGNQGSGILQSMSLANGLAICPSNKKSINKGKKVKVIIL